MTGLSLWLRTGPSLPSDLGPPPPTAEVVIAGAGLTGLTLARMLADVGVRPVVIEARAVGAGTTGHTTGKLSVLQGEVYANVRRHAGDDAVRAYAEAQAAGQAWLRKALGDAPDSVETASALTFAETERGAAAIEREMRAMRAAGVVPRTTGGATSTGRLALAPRAVLRMDGQGKLHAMRVLAELARQLRAVDVRIVERCRVTDADVDRDEVRVATERGVIRCRHLVLATGIPVLDRGLFFAKLLPERSFVAGYRVDEGVELPEGMLLSVDEPAHSLRVDPDEHGEPLLLVGGGGHVTGRAASTRGLLDELDGWTVSRWPSARRALWWAAQDYRSVDGVPYAGELPRGGGRIWTATGYDKWGMTNAVASALRLVGAMYGGAPAWAEELAHHGSRWATAAEALRDAAAVGARLASGWARAETASADGPPAEGEGRVVSEGAYPVAESTVDGVTCRVSGVCTHLGGVVAWNDAERSWDCPLHGSRFAADGTLLEGPAVEGLPRR